MVVFGSGNETTLAQLPHDLIVDRVISSDPTPSLGPSAHSMTGSALTVSHSYVSEIHVVGRTLSDRQFTAQGPFKIAQQLSGRRRGKHLFGAAIRLFNLRHLGRRSPDNYLYKPLSWYANDPAICRDSLGRQNFFELKMPSALWWTAMSWKIAGSTGSRVMPF